MHSIEIKHLSKSYKQQIAVNDVSFSIKKGIFFALLGFNGAGKTTLIKMLTGLTKPSSGDAMILGKSINQQMNDIKKDINISPQETAIAQNLTVCENLIFMAEIYGFSKEEASHKAIEMMERFSILDRKNDKAKTLSGGYKRRLSIAMALISDPKILFLDEPTLGLDVRARKELWHILMKLKGEVTIVLTTHYLDEVEALADEIAIIDFGKLKAIGTIDSLSAQTGLNKLEDIFLSFTTGDAII